MVVRKRRSCKLNARGGRRKGGSGVLSSLAGVASTLGGVASTVLNKTINSLPIELHLPGYNFCGPGTKLKARLERGDKGINALDSACKSHDISYANSSDNASRSIADKVLANKAWEIVKDSNRPNKERGLAYLVTLAMKAKSAIGGGLKRGARRRQMQETRRNAIRKLTNHVKGRGFYLRPYPQYFGGGRVLNSTEGITPPQSAFGLTPVKKTRRRSVKKKKVVVRKTSDSSRRRRNQSNNNK